MIVYILITPAKNEEKDLPKVAESVISQTLRPALWVIVDDGSTDNSPAIIKNLEKQCDWIQSIRLPEHPRDITFHYSYVCKNGFTCAIEYCSKNSIDYDFIGLLDADTCLTETYFEQLISAFVKDPGLGIASGGIYYDSNGTLQWIRILEKYPAGTGRLWRKACFFETGGYQVEPSPDSISTIKAGLNGWKTQNFKEIIAVQTRPTSGAEGVWKGYTIDGKNAYYLNKHPILVFLNFMDFSTQKPFYIGIAYAYGFLKAFIRRDKKIDDKQIKDYYWNNRIHEYLPHFLQFK
jgi:glycosyltransferase involved in cell wall biosynthesis